MAKIEGNRTQSRIKQTGEVFTPPGLVAKMLDTLPREVWEENKTFCDPAAGDGNFIVTVELMKDNCITMQRRLLSLVQDTPEHRAIIGKNIVWANSLQYDMEFDKLTDNRAETERLEK
jgi:type I restriction-modification system DNA methylase subunit